MAKVSVNRKITVDLANLLPEELAVVKNGLSGITSGEYPDADKAIAQDLLNTIAISGG